MKVLLVNPLIDNMITTNLPSYVDEERGYNPPLGLMYVAAYAEQHTNCEIEILDMLAEEVTYDRLESELRRRKPDIVGVTATTFTRTFWRSFSACASSSAPCVGLAHRTSPMTRKAAIALFIDDMDNRIIFASHLAFKE